jgi:hypothetical protein
MAVGDEAEAVRAAVAHEHQIRTWQLAEDARVIGTPIAESDERDSDGMIHSDAVEL